MNDLVMNETIKQYFANPRKVVKVIPDEHFTLILTFDNGEVRQYDMSDKLFGVFSILKDKEKFKAVFIDETGNVAWDKDPNIDSESNWQNRIDICKDAIYMASTPVQKE